MTCVSCQNRIEKKLKNTAGIIKAEISYNAGIADITFDSEIISLNKITVIIEKMDYQVVQNYVNRKIDMRKIICMLALIVFLYLLLEQFGILNLLVPGQLADSKMGYGMLLAIGFITSFHCIAMCGGINLSQCIPREASQTHDQSRFYTLRPALLYNLGRVASYTVTGFLLGLVGFLLGGGTSYGISTMLQGILKLIAGTFMVIMGINMLDLFPGLRKFYPRMPKFLTAKINAQKAKSNRPLIVGLLNGLMPCGPLQSMQLVALASGSPISGMLSMLLFSLGTVPLMLGLGAVVSLLGQKFTKKVMNIGAILVIVLGLAMFSQGRSLSGLFAFTSQSNSSQSNGSESNEQLTEGTQVVTSTLSLGEYPDITVQVGVPVKWVINAPDGSINGCNYRMLIQEYGIEYTLQEDENVIEFTPTEVGNVSYSCWMGMIRGNILVTDSAADGS